MTAAGREILAGNTRAAARLMRDLDDEMPTAIRILKELYRHTGRAYILGVTGAPGAGKSTLVNRITTHLRKRGKSVGIVARKLQLHRSSISTATSSTSGRSSTIRSSSCSRSRRP